MNHDKKIENSSCCPRKESLGKKGFFQGIFYGILPHFPCLAFIIFSVLGVTFATALFRPLLLNRYFFYFLIALSLVFASFSALIYLKRNKILSYSGIKRKWKYLLVLYGTTVTINLLLFIVIFPLVANLGQTKNNILSGNFITLKVDIPCPGHGPLVIEELKRLPGIENIKFRFPNFFDISFNPKIVSKEKILAIDILKIYQGKIIKEGFEGQVCPLY